MPIHEAAMWSAFQQTTYVARVEEADLTIRVGQPTPVLDQLLARRHASSWCFVTAWNPQAEPLDAAENEARNLVLLEALGRCGWSVFEGEGRGADGHWLAEASFLVLGPDRCDAALLGQRHGQVAVVFGERGGVAQLVDCRAPRANLV